MSFLRPAEVKYLMMGQVIPVRRQESSSAEKGLGKSGFTRYLALVGL